MSYSGQSNPPWQRNAGQLGLQNQINQLGLQNLQYQNVPFTQFSGNSTNQILQAPQAPFTAVSYPHQNTRNIITSGAFSANNSNQPSSGSSNSQNQSSNYNSVGIITKLHNDCGFVDDEVFFHKNVCKSGVPKLGDKVIVEATFNSSSPFKWNATRIQIVSSGGSMGRNQPPPLMGTNISSNIKGGPVSGSGYNAVPPPNEYGRSLVQGQRRHASPPPRLSPDRHSRHRDDGDNDRKRRREERDRERERERDRGERERERERIRDRDKDKRDYSLERRERERSPVRRISPKRRRTRTIPRYMVQIPKICLTIREADVLELRRRYVNLYIPSDFFHTEIKWPEAFTPDKPFSIHRPCSFHIMHKSVNPPKELSTPGDPSDANYLYSAKVMLMGVPSVTEFYEKCLSNEKEREDDRDYIHPSRLINFLIGVRGKNEMMAIGGPWSPSLDGENPESNPAVLIKTAIRTCKALTGIDLSSCTQWYRFVELYYRRPETVHKGQVIPARIETVVIFLPDINSCVPTSIEWDNLHNIYKQGLERALNPSENNPSDDNNSSHNNSTDGGGVCVTDKENLNDKTAVSDGGEGKVNQDEGKHEEGNDKNKKEATHYTKLDPKVMKIQELRDELEARNLPSKGLKPQLVARLVKILNTEKNEEENGSTNKPEGEIESEDIEQSAENDQGGDDNIESMDMNDMVILDEYDSTKNRETSPGKKENLKILDEKEKRQLERRYQLPENPHIIVHPSRTAKSGKFDCITMSLSVLLDYRPEDTKERSFEVSLFAELFNEMIMRDFGFNIYKEIALIPEKMKDKDEITTGTTKKEEDQKINNNTTENKLKKDDEEKKENEKSVRIVSEMKNNDHDTKSVSSGNGDKKSTKDREKDKEKGDRISKRPHTEDESEDDNFSIKSGDKRRRRKMIIGKHDLLLSFVYFDTTHCGYIFEKDIEDLFYILGLNLSRNQVRKLLSKVISRDALYYRKLTDKPKDGDETVINVQNTNDLKNLVDLAQLAKGNKILLPNFGIQSQEEKQNHKIIKLENEKDIENKSDSADGMIFYNGGLVDVGKLIDQMKRSDKAREEIEKLLTDLRKQNSDLQNINTKSNSKIKDLQSEVKSLNRKLLDSEQSLSSMNRKYNEYYSVLSNIYDKVSPIFKNERSHKSDRDRDRDRERDRDRNDKDKEKLEEKERGDNRNEKDDKEKMSKDEKDQIKDKDIKEKDDKKMNTE